MVSEWCVTTRNRLAQQIGIAERLAQFGAET
jgi:hypothetical protein